MKTASFYLPDTRNRINLTGHISAAFTNDFNCGILHEDTREDSIPGGNPVIRHKYTADPAEMVFNGTVYLYTGHDEAPLRRDGYFMHVCFSLKAAATDASESPIIEDL